MNKNEVRSLMIEKRKSIINKKELSTIIVDKLLNLDIYKKAKVIALYRSLKDEVDTSLLIAKSLKEKIVLLPKVMDNKMIFIRINQDTIFKKSTFGVLEPIGEVFNDNIDLIIVPGVSFDKELNRLGFGSGYYDKYLSNKNIYKIGIGFDAQIVSNLPVDNYDIKMDMIITDNGSYS